LATRLKPLRAAASAPSGVAVPAQNGGCGFWKLDRHVDIAIELAVKRQRALGECLPQYLQRFEIHLLSVIGIDPVVGGLDRRDAAADAQLEAAPAELVEHADLLDHSQGVVERKRVDEGTETQALRALRDGGKKNAGRGGKAEWRRVMFGRVIGVEAAAIVGFDNLQPLLIERVEGPVVAIEVVENADLHCASSRFRAEGDHRRKHSVSQDRRIAR
jgi:hypothetical protein